jgi:uncharacterized membrane protein YciS (DUF1049 family)
MSNYSQSEVDYIVRQHTQAADFKGSCLAIVMFIVGTTIGAILIFGIYNWGW